MAGRNELISVRLDRETVEALQAIAGSELSRSEAVRMAIVEAAEHRRRRAALAAEAELLAADPKDRAEMAEVASLMEELRAPR